MLFIGQPRHREVDFYSQRKVANRTGIEIQSRILKVIEKCAWPSVNSASEKEVLFAEITNICVP